VNSDEKLTRMTKFFSEHIFLFNTFRYLCEYEQVVK